MSDDTVVQLSDGRDGDEGPGGGTDDPIQQGQKDPLGDIVDRIHVRTDTFVIYSINCTGGEVRRPRSYFFAEQKTAAAYRQHLNTIGTTLNRVTDLLIGMRPDILTMPYYEEHYKSLVERAREHQAQAMWQAFEGNATEAAAMLADFRMELENCRDSRNKMRYVLANAAAILLLLAIWLGVRWQSGTHADVGVLLTGPLTLPTADAGAVVRLIDMLTLGAIGAFFSVSIGINGLKINNAITIPEMFYAGFVRILIGVIAAGVVFLLIFGGWILTAVAPAYQLWTFYLFAFLAGFSELLVPNALKRVEDSTAVEPPPAKLATG